MKKSEACIAITPGSKLSGDLLGLHLVITPNWVTLPLESSNNITKGLLSSEATNRSQRYTYKSPLTLVGSGGYTYSIRERKMGAWVCSKGSNIHVFSRNRWRFFQSSDTTSFAPFLVILLPTAMVLAGRSHLCMQIELQWIYRLSGSHCGGHLSSNQFFTSPPKQELLAFKHPVLKDKQD